MRRFRSTIEVSGDQSGRPANLPDAIVDKEKFKEVLALETDTRGPQEINVHTLSVEVGGKTHQLHFLSGNLGPRFADKSVAPLYYTSERTKV